MGGSQEGAHNFLLKIMMLTSEIAAQNTSLFLCSVPSVCLSVPNAIFLSLLPLNVFQSLYSPHFLSFCQPAKGGHGGPQFLPAGVK